MRRFVLVGLLAVLASCSDRSFSPTVPEALEVGAPYTVFAVTNREQKENGIFGFGRSDDLRLLQMTVSIPPNHQPGTLEFGYAKPDPVNQFTMAERSEFLSTDAFVTRIKQELAQLPADERVVTVFVHGFNSTQAETVFRAAQLATDVQLPGLVIAYSWPSRGAPLGYVYDNDSMLFARDGLENLLATLNNSGIDRPLLVAHSLGSALTMETLRQMDIRQPGLSARSVNGVIMVSPDLDIEVFRHQMRRLDPVPQPFVVLVSGSDRALDVSARLRGAKDRQRLGNIRSVAAVADLPIEVVDTTSFSQDAGSSHFIPATSPALLALVRSAARATSTLEKEAVTFEGLIGLRGIKVKRATAIGFADLPVTDTP